jgi:hypothetical protein
MMACQRGHTETARALLDHRAATDYRNKVLDFIFMYSHETAH